MIKVTLITNAGRSTLLVDANTTVRTVLDDNNVNYAVGTTSIDGSPLKTGEMDKTFAALGVDEKCYLAVVVKADNAAKAVISGSACVVTSTVKREDLETIKKYRPNALTAYEGEGDKREPVFAVNVCDGPGSINTYGATFGKATDSEGHATITILLDPNIGDPAAVIEEKIGMAMLQLSKLESGVEQILGDIKKEREEIRGHIQVN